MSPKLFFVPSAALTLLLTLGCSGSNRDEVLADGGGTPSTSGEGGNSLDAGGEAQEAAADGNAVADAVADANASAEADANANTNTGVDADANASAEAGEAGGEAGDDQLFVPEGLSNTLVDGEQGDQPLTLIAFTLVQGATSPELYAAVRNDGQTPLCEVGMTTYFVDKNDELVTSVGSAFQIGQLYRLSTGDLIPCIAPGQIAMAASTDLPDTIVIDELGYLKHSFPAFIVNDIILVDDALTVSGVNVVGNAYTGTFTNGLDVTVSAPAVTVFPVNRVGRPLGVATSRGTLDVPPDGSWIFETSAVDDLGAGYVAFPSASISSE